MSLNNSQGGTSTYSIQRRLALGFLLPSSPSSSVLLGETRL